MTTKIVSFETLSEPQREKAVEIFMSALAHFPSAWHDLTSARAEVATFFDNPDRLAFAALDGQDLVGWVGGIRYSPHAWELHPLVVAPGLQRRGYGSVLLAALEDAARGAGINMIWLGTDDDFDGTNLFGLDLYPNVFEHLARLAPTAGHPYTFYQARGYTVVGVLPDATGIGKHDILMAKRIGACEP